MKKLCFLILFLAIAIAPLKAQPAADPEAAAIRQAALDYIEGWYEAMPPAWSASDQAVGPMTLWPSGSLVYGWNHPADERHPKYRKYTVTPVYPLGARPRNSLSS